MSFIRFDLTSYSRSIALGVEYENTTLSAPINEWSWVLDGDKIFSQISSFDPLFQECIDRNVSYYGDFNFTDNGLLIESESRISKAKFEDVHGTFEVTFDVPLTWKELNYSSIKENIYDSNNVFVGTINDDLISAGKGDDVLAGGEGDDIVNGEEGLDIAVFVGEKDQYLIHLSSQFQLIVSDIDPSDRDYGEDKLTGIEVVAFNEEYFAMSDLRLEALLNSPASVSRNVNRLFNSHTGKHLFSANQLEIDYLVGGGNGWSNEGISYSTPESPTAEIYRFLVASENRHFYTANQAERDNIIAQLPDFVYEGIAYNAYSIKDYPQDAIPVVRYFNPVINTHLYSTSSEEQHILDKSPQWINEGLAWFGDPI